MVRIIRVVAVTALLVVLAAALSSVLAAPSGDDPSPAQDPAEAEAPDSIRIAPADGSPSVAEAEALAAARDFAPYDAADNATSVTTQYVLFSKDDYYDVRPDGKRDYKYQDRPVWLVTYAGIYVPSHGGNPSHKTEFNVVVDAETGQALFGYSYR